jgi:hypothetical protein
MNFFIFKIESTLRNYMFPLSLSILSRDSNKKLSYIVFSLETKYT